MHTAQLLEMPSRNQQPDAPRLLGGKANALLELQIAGFRVPEFLCSPSDPATALECLGTPLAVRSSASAEDGRTVSFAGQFKSFLNVRNLEQLRDAVRQCRDSICSPSVVEYCRRNGIDPSSLRMEVIVQRMIEPELAGVAFTIDPATGAERVVIEACVGLADGLLAGRTRALAMDHPLLVKYAPEIERVARKIQRHFGAPQDIEFAIAHGAVYILQSRPITRIHFAPSLGEWTNADFRDGGVSCGVCTPLQWSLYNFIWEPALKGFLRDIKLLDRDFQAGRTFFGRPYWNVGEVKRCLARLPGFVERQFDQDLSLQISYEGDGHCTPVTPWRILKALPTIFAIESAWKDQEQFDVNFLEAGFEKLVAPFQRISDQPEAALRDLIHGPYWITESNYFRTIYCASLAKLDFLDSFPEVDYAALVSGLPDLRHLEPIRIYEEMKARGETDLAPLLARFRHCSRRELDIRAPRWDEDCAWVEQFLRNGEDPGTRGAVHMPLSESLNQKGRVAFHRVREGDDPSPRRTRWNASLPDDAALGVRGGSGNGTEGSNTDRSPLLARSAKTVERNLSEAKANFENTRAKALAGLPRRQRARFVRKLDRLRKFIWLREEMRDLSCRVYYLIRRHVLAIAESRGLGDDIFFMTLREILNDDRSHIERHRETYESYREFRAPNEIGSRFKFDGESKHSDEALRGIAVSHGAAHGTARIARSVEETLRIENGAILVCAYTDPGWTPVLGRVAGVVTETGGMLSHAAVICREFGIPAVLNVPDATRRIRDGNLVAINGTEGYVEIIS